ncbi:MAG: hypothetical protein P8Y44_01015 [Acidobacteriota bacterium]
MGRYASNRYDKIGRAVLALASLAVTPLLAQSSSPLLLDLSGQLATVRYSPGALDRASKLQDQVEALVENFNDLSKEKIPLGIFILSPEDWGQFGLQEPYGMPVAMGGRGLAVPAWGTDESVRLWQSLMKERLPTMPEASISRGSPEQTASLLVSDIIALPEVARVQLRAAGFRADERWVEGVASHIVALAAAVALKDPRVPEMRMIYAGLEAAGGGPKAHPLSELQALKTGQSKMWFESQFFAAASIVTAANGKQSAKKMLRSASKRGNQITASDLISNFPELNGWLTSSFSAP